MLERIFNLLPKPKKHILDEKLIYTFNIINEQIDKSLKYYGISHFGSLWINLP